MQKRRPRVKIPGVGPPLQKAINPQEVEFWGEQRTLIWK